MTRDQIIHNLFTGTNFSSCISKMEPDHLREDLKQEVILVVCEMPHEKVIGLYERKELDFYVARIILNHVKSNTSPFYKKYRRAFYEYFGDIRKDQEAGFQTKQGVDLTKAGEKAALKHLVVDFTPEEESSRAREDREMLEDEAMAEIAAMKDHKEHWYAYELIQLYIKHNNFRAIEKETRIPFISCYKTIKKTILEIRAKVDYIKSNPLCNRTK